MHTPRVMILIVEPISNPQLREYIPAWKDELVETILLKLASTALVAGTITLTSIVSWLDIL